MPSCPCPAAILTYAESDRWWVLPACMALLLAVGIDLFYFPPTTVLPDEQRFLASAVKLAATGQFWVGSDRAWEMPGTALFYAPFVKLAGADSVVVWIRMAQAVLFALNAVLTGMLARAVMPTRPVVGFFAASIAAIYPFFLFYQGLLLSETLFMTLLLLSLVALYRWTARGCRIDMALCLSCFLFAVATLTKATLTAFPPLLLGITAWLSGASLRKSVAVVIVSAGLLATFLSPWWLRNAAVLGSFVPLTTGSAQNLYLGNNPMNVGAGVDWHRDVERATADRLLSIPNEVDRQRAFAKAGVDYIIEQPGRFVVAAVNKFLRFWNVIPNAAEYGTLFYRVVSAASFGPVLVLALLAVGFERRSWRTLMPLYLVLAYFTALHVVTIASLRYRFPIEPLLIVLAALSIERLLQFQLSGRRK